LAASAQTRWESLGLHCSALRLPRWIWGEHLQEREGTERNEGNGNGMKRKAKRKERERDKVSYRHFFSPLSAIFVVIHPTSLK